MNKLITLFSLLLFVAYVNTTSKITYSEIVSSLSEVAHVEGAEQLINTVANNWKENVQKLEGYNTAIANQCNGILKRGNQRLENFQTNQNNINNSITELENDNKKFAGEVQNLNNVREENNQKIQAMRNDIRESRQDVQVQVLAIVERERVLRRLDNLIEDELVGKQRNTNLGNINVDKTLSGFSFVETRSQLKDLKSNDPIVKSMISTLILITQDEKNLFSNQENVEKIRAMIEEIIKKDQNNIQNIRQEVTDKIAKLEQGIHDLSDTMIKDVETLAEKRATIARNLQTIKFSRTTLKSLENQISRAQVRKNSNLAICKQVQDRIKIQRQDFNSANSRFEELREMLARE